MKYALILLSILCIQYASAQKQLIQNKDYTIQETKATKLGTTQKVSKLIARSVTSPDKKALKKSLKSVPDNFKGRRGNSNVVIPELEHLGPDKLRQTGFDNASIDKRVNSPIINIDGLVSNFGSPHDPTGDVNDEFYLQAINVTEIGVYDLEGTLVARFAANTLWTEFGVNSLGDPIILYDEESDRWIITEFTNPANLLVAVSVSSDPVGEYNAYNFSTPSFPDYPKYAVTPDMLVLTTNEGGPGRLHQYFIDLNAMEAGEANARIQRLSIDGNTNTEAPFYVSTPVDWNGDNRPYDNNPITMRVNDSSWGDAAQDQVEVYSFDVDFSDVNRTIITQTSIPLAPFDTFPCAALDGGFACIPQRGGTGLDGIPHVIMNIPHLRNFGTHESVVFNFITDVTDGENISGIRWVELRRTETTDWELYQEGTFAPDDGLHRFMGSIAMDGNGNIGLGYNVSGPNDFVGIRYTGRIAADPLGVMTINEVNVVEGVAAVRSMQPGRFGDYSQMSVSPLDNSFWFTGEYAGNANGRSRTRIFSFEINQDSLDLAVTQLLSPIVDEELTDQENVIAEISNLGILDVESYEVGLLIDGQLIESSIVNSTLTRGENVEITFNTPVDLSEFRIFDVEAYVNILDDGTPDNDTLDVAIINRRNLDATLSGAFRGQNCIDNTLLARLDISNPGINMVDNVIIEVSLNGAVIDTVTVDTNIGTDEEFEFIYETAAAFIDGDNNLSFDIINLNDNELDDNELDNQLSIVAPFDPNQLIVNLIIRTDNFPQEISWTFTEEGSRVNLAEGALDATQQLQEVVIPLCVSTDRCYEVVLFDSYGDGLCCAGGIGNFRIEDEVGNRLVTNNGQFGFSTTEAFCAGMVGCNISAVIDVTNSSSSNDNDGIIMITASNGIGDFAYSIDGGITFVSGNVFDNLLPGDYPVVVTDGEGRCTFEELITVSFSTSTLDLLPNELVIKPNPTDGVIEVSLPSDGLSQPFIEFQVLDMKGQILQARKLGIYDDHYLGTISILNYPAGQYLLRYIADSGTGIARIIKN